jgi:hypothetical protein
MGVLAAFGFLCLFDPGGGNKRSILLYTITGLISFDSTLHPT